jgi:hypothetical protein
MKADAAKPTANRHDRIAHVAYARQRISASLPPKHFVVLATV